MEGEGFNGSTERPMASLDYSPVHCVIVTVYLVAAAIIGTGANSLITAVYSLKKHKCPHEIFMLSVASINLFGSCCFIPWEILIVWGAGHDSCNSPPDYIIIFRYLSLSLFLTLRSLLIYLES